MKRTGLKRGTKGLKRTGPIKPKRISIVPGKSSVNPTRPKGKSWTAEERRERDKVHERSNRSCEVCDAARTTNYQHRLPEGRGGPTTAANGLDVCGMGNASGCHGRIHQNPNLAVYNGWTVDTGEDPAKRQVLRRGEWVYLRPDGGMDPAPAPSLPFEEAS